MFGLGTIGFGCWFVQSRLDVLSRLYYPDNFWKPAVSLQLYMYSKPCWEVSGLFPVFLNSDT